ncbi:MAG: hypothetical protein AB1458_15155 [Bacteroidota bacterium]
MKQLTSGILLLLLCLYAPAQIILLHEDVKSDSVVSRFGPNRTHYIQSFYGSGFILGPSDSAGAEIKPWKSWYLNYGLRYKLKLGGYYALGLDVYYQFVSYRIKQSPEKVLPDTILHEKEKLNLHNISGAFFNRINFSKRGDIIGNYFDFGVYGDYVAASTHVYRDQNAAGSASDKTTIKKHGLAYISRHNYGVFARIGWNNFAFWGQYRLSNMFDKSYPVNYPELPRIFIGFEFSSR